jgi:Holliday junction DNA helicase RuvA
MIGKLKGILHEVEGNKGLIETSGGVFYQVFLTPVLLTKYKNDNPIELYTYLQVREDALILFGFQSKEEYTMFQMLIGVSGVGPKTAYSVISFSNPSELIEAIKTNNIDYFTKIPGLGKKTGMKIILELSQKLKSEFKMADMYLSEEDKTVVDALVSLGFKSQEAKTILSKLPKNLSIEQKIQDALKKRV